MDRSLVRLTVRRTIPYPALAVAAVLLAAGCRDTARDDAANDSALSRDLTLASAIAATPQLRDMPDSNPPVERPEPEPAVRPAPKPVRSPARTAPRREPAATPKPAPAPEPPPVEEAPAPAPEPARRTGVVAAGTSVGLTIDSRACSDANRVGDKMVAHTSEAITGTNGLVFPAGSTVVLEIASITQGGTPDSSSITFRVKSITANGATHVVTGDVVPTGTLEKKRVATSSSDKKKVVGGAILGAVLGRVVGGDTKGTVIGAAAGAAVGAGAAAASARYETCVPEGTPLRLVIGGPVEVEL